MTPFVAEFLGTCLLLILGNGVVAGVVLKGTKSENAGWLVIAIGWGLAVSISIYMVGPFSGAHINPAVTLAMVLTDNLPLSDAWVYWSAQFLGGFVGATLVWIFYLPHYNLTKDADLKRATFCTSPAKRHTISNFFSEFFATTFLILTLLFLGATKFSDGLNPLVVGLVVVSIGLSLGGTTGYAINPARDLAPRLAHYLLPISGKTNSDWGYAWIPVVAPLLGAAFAVGLFQFLNYS